MRLRTTLQILAVTILSTFVSPADARTDAAIAPPAADAALAPQAVFRPLEVRTRRLHLVRPDLMHYPIQYDTYC
jgi:hypothetical protein